MLAVSGIYTLNGASFFFIVFYEHYVSWLYIILLFIYIVLRYIFGRLSRHLFSFNHHLHFWVRSPLGANDLFGVQLLSTNLVGAIPIIGDKILLLLWGSFFISQPTLARFFVL